VQITSSDIGQENQSDIRFQNKNVSYFKGRRVDAEFASVFKDSRLAIAAARNNWVCYDFRERRIVTTHYTIRSGVGVLMKSRAVGISVDGSEWIEIDRRDYRSELNRDRETRVFVVA
jgi:hypothetical protein